MHRLIHPHDVKKIGMHQTRPASSIAAFFQFWQYVRCRRFWQWTLASMGTLVGLRLCTVWSDTIFYWSIQHKPAFTPRQSSVTMLPLHRFSFLRPVLRYHNKITNAFHLSCQWLLLWLIIVCGECLVKELIAILSQFIICNSFHFGPPFHRPHIFFIQLMQSLLPVRNFKVLLGYYYVELAF